MESVWWVFKQLYEKGLVYRGVKVMPYSTGCTTALSNFESNLNYKDHSDPSIVITFPLEEDPSVAFLAWTTTPWTLPSNLAICVNPEFVYLKVKDRNTGAFWILAECRLSQVYDVSKENQYEVICRYQGSELEGKAYIPLFDYFAGHKARGAFRVVADSYVTNDAGTGVVHQAPGFGEDDYRVCLKAGIISKGTDVVCPLDANGRFLPEVPDFVGQYIKDTDGPICAMLKSKGRLVSKKAEVHSYPYCWRSQTPLIYRCVASWFVEVEKFKDRLLERSRESYWVPEFVQTKRFNNWLSDARDWCVSRSRYWGTPLPIWHSDDWEEIVVIGSVKELEELSGQKFTDIHRDFIDSVTIPSKMGKEPLKRVEEVFDCWFESGSMPYAQLHYPFENKDKFEKGFPADFIAEGLDQTRGWFYTLLVLSTGLYDKPAFKNLIVNGLVLAADGKKMSKSLKNYPDPMEVINDHSADALRLYLINSPVVRAEPLAFKKDGVKDVVKDVLLPLWNAQKFFVQNYSRFVRDGHVFSRTLTPANPMDKWILASSNHLIEFVSKEMKMYRLYTVVPELLKFLDNLTNWYVRMNRKRLKGDGGVEDCAQALSTLFNTLMTSIHLLSPFIPFMTEHMYQRLSQLLPDSERQQSIHYCMIPKPDDSMLNPIIERQVERLQAVVELTRVMRDRNNIPLKMPITNLIVLHPSQEYLDDVEQLKWYLQEELNCLSLETSKEEGAYIVLSAEANLAVLGKRLKKDAKAVSEKIKKLTPEKIRDLIRSGTIVVDGHVVSNEDVRVVRNFKPGIENFDTKTNGDVLVLMDKRADEKLHHMWIAREFVNKVQQLRKSAGLTPGDMIHVYYTNVEEDPTVTAALLSQNQFVSDNLRVPWFNGEVTKPRNNVIIREECSFKDKKMLLLFTSPDTASSG
jgi:isoleucyl-tRNA synthetase